MRNLAVDSVVFQQTGLVPASVRAKPRQEFEQYQIQAKFFVCLKNQRQSARDRIKCNPWFLERLVSSNVEFFWPSNRSQNATSLVHGIQTGENHSWPAHPRLSWTPARNWANPGGWIARKLPFDPININDKFQKYFDDGWHGIYWPVLESATD